MAKVPPKNRRKMVGVKLRQKGAKRLAPVVMKARNRIDALINAAVRNPKFASSEVVRQKLYRQIEAQYTHLQSDVNAYSEKYATDIARVWRKFAIADLGGLYGQSWGGFSKKYLKEIIRGINIGNISGRAAVKAPQLSAQLGGMLQNDIRVLRKAVVDVARLGATEGLTAKQIREETQRRVLSERPAWSFIDRSGRKWKASNYFKMLNKTIYNNVANETYVSAMTEAGVDLMQFEGGPSTVGDSCDDWVGRIVSVTGATKGYPTLEEATSSSHMYGPNCNHYPGAVLPGELPEAKVREEATRDAIKQLDEYKQEAIDAGVPKSRAHEVVEQAAKKAKVGITELTPEQFSRHLGKVA